jgi:hypothetical protein
MLNDDADPELVNSASCRLHVVGAVRVRANRELAV